MKTANLFAHQQRALDLLRHSLGRGRRRPMLQAPTGSGKTVLACSIGISARMKGNPLLFVVPAIDLVDQTIKAFRDEGLDCAAIQGDHPETDASKTVQVASVQSLMRRQIPQAGVVIIDEAHRWFQFTGEWMAMESWRDVPFIGLSATPWTTGLGHHYDDLLIPTTIKELIGLGRLSPFKIFAPSKPDLTGVHTVAGDWNQGETAERMQEPDLQGDIVKTWRERWGKGKTICFAVDRAHAQALRRAFAGQGVSTGYIDAFTKREDRRQLECDFTDGLVDIVFNVGVWTTGIDLDTRCIILARPTKSEMLYVQMLGRGLRTAPGKEHLLILDHSDTVERLGWPDDIHHATLDGGEWEPSVAIKEAPAQPLPKACPSCKEMMLPRASTCPSCGFKAQRQSPVTYGDHELEEKARPKHDPAQKQAWWSMLLGMAEQRGKSRGWASHKFREKFKVWPNHYEDIPTAPSPEVIAYVRSRQIAFAKGRKVA